jgi:phenylacetate-CoA ligase
MLEPETIERLPLNDIFSFQHRELQKALQYAALNSPYYKRMFATPPASINSIETIADLSFLPFTTKDDLLQYNLDFLCVPQHMIIDYVTTSGTLGSPVTIALTDKDLNRLAENECNSFRITGGTATDIYQLMTTIDRQFMAGMAYFLGARKLGAGIIRVGNGIPELQWTTIMRIKPSTIICVPSFILKLIEYAEANGIDYRNSSVQKAICIGEALRNDDYSLNKLGEKIKEKWDIALYSTYASSEMGAAFTECAAGMGGHLQPGLVITEVIDDNDQPVADGEMGELVITTLGIEGMPLIRFKTGDLCRFHYSPCSCGRNTPRISPVLGRKKQMIKYKGTTLYPGSLYDILDSIDEVKNYQVEIYTNEIGTDEILVRIGCNDVTEKLEKEIKDHFRARLRVAPTIRFEQPEHLQKLLFPEMLRKPLKFIDKRS